MFYRHAGHLMQLVYLFGFFLVIFNMLRIDFLFCIRFFSFLKDLLLMPKIELDYKKKIRFFKKYFVDNTN